MAKKIEEKNPPKVFDVTNKSYFLIMIDNKSRRKDVKISINPELMTQFEDNLLHYLILLNTRFHIEEDIRIDNSHNTPETADKTRYIG